MSRKSNPSSHPTPFIENLENRILMKLAHPTQVVGAFFDNRGNVQLNMSIGIDPTTLSRKTAALWTAGGDGQFGTPDDTRLYTAVGYRKGLITLRATTALNQRYRVILNASVIKDINGFFLDGEFNGDGVASGNGVAGGNYDVVTNAPAKVRVRFTTVEGYITAVLNTKTTPHTTTNFLHYANLGAWDTTFFHRSEHRTNSGGLDVIQGGGFNVTNGSVGSVHADPGIGLELGNSNVAGTIAMARTNDPNSNTNQWFFNTKANTELNTTGGGYTVFGAVADKASLATILRINGLKIVDVSNGGQNPFSELPVVDPAAGSTRAVKVPNDLVMVSRVAQLMDVAKTPTTGVQRSLTTSTQPPTPASTPFLVTKDEKNTLLE